MRRQMLVPKSMINFQRKRKDPLAQILAFSNSMYEPVKTLEAGNHLIQMSVHYPCIVEFFCCATYIQVDVTIEQRLDEGSETLG